jgi:hypothetical protein
VLAERTHAVLANMTRKARVYPGNNSSNNFIQWRLIHVINGAHHLWDFIGAELCCTEQWHQHKNITPFADHCIDIFMYVGSSFLLEIGNGEEPFVLAQVCLRL